MDKRVRILVPDTGRGLWRDAELIAGLVREKGLEASVLVRPLRSGQLAELIHRLDLMRNSLPRGIQNWVNRLQVALYRTRSENSVVATIHLQRIQSRYIAGPHENWLIPNSEWYQRERIPYLPLMNRILCKTQEAKTIFQAFNDNAVYTGFSGLLPDPHSTVGPKDFKRFLHVAGNNRKKGTTTLVNAWSQHPEWPTLDLVIEDGARLPVIPRNIRVHERVDDETLNQLRRVCGVAVAPSEAEGFGHSLLDAMVWGQVVVTVDAPPMNELVSSDRGVLVGWSHSRPCRLGTQYFVDQQRLEDAISQILETDEESLQTLSMTARDWVASNHEAFRQRLHAMLEELVHEG